MVGISFRIKEKAINWAKSYLADKTQSVIVNDDTSALYFGVPLGSVF